MSQMLKESLEASQKVQEFLEKDIELYQRLGNKLRELDPQFVATIARGSSDHAATYASYLIPMCTGRVVASIPPSSVTVLKSDLRMKNQCVLAISESGSSPDILNTFELCKKSGALGISLVNVADSPLAKTADFFLDQHAGIELGLAATKSVLCTKAAIARLAAEWTRDSALASGLRELPRVLKSAAEKGMTLNENLFEGVTNVLVISRALGSGAAFELSLKIKETCGIHAEAFSSAEVRHGPREIVNEKYAIIALALPGSGKDDVIATAIELKNQGARVMIVVPDPTFDFNLPTINENRLYPLVALQMLYPWIARVSQKLGRDPDKPKTLKSKVIHTI